MGIARFWAILRGDEVFDRRRLLMPLLAPALGGIFTLVVLGAPTSYALINAACVAVATFWIRFGRLPTMREPKGQNARLAIASLACALLFAPMITGPAQGVVSRWVPAGPIALHTGPLLLPLIAMLATEHDDYGIALLAAATLAFALQPDAAALLALGLAGGVLCVFHALEHRTKNAIGFGLTAAAALALAAFSFESGALPPQPFVEGILNDLAEKSLIQAGALAFVLFSSLWYFMSDPQVSRAHSRALTAILIGLTATALMGPYPYPLIAYGPASILGFGLALGALPRKDQMKGSAFMEIMDRNR